MTTSQFDKFLKETHGQMLRFAVSILRNKADAEDVVAQVSERLWREREKLEPTPKASSFAMVSVRTGCSDHSRYRQRRVHDATNESIAESESLAERNDTIELVRFAMGQLPEKWREILHLKDIEGYSTHEIAEIFSTSESNVRMILSRSRTALKEIIMRIKQMQR